MNSIGMVTAVFMVLLILLTGILLAITPWLMRRNECFAVTIPADKQNDARLLALKRRYSKSMIFVSAVLAALEAVAFFVLTRQPGDVSESMIVAIVLPGVLLPVVISFVLMLRARREVQAIKVQEGWRAVSQQTVALVAEDDAPGAVSLAWNLLYIPLVASCMVLAWVLYPSMPDQIPMHMSFAGEVDSYVSKWPAVFAFPALLTAFMALTMVFCHWTIARSKRPTDLGAPVTSAFAYGMFARAQSIFLLATGLVITAAINFGFVFVAAELITLGQMTGLILVASFLVVVAAIVLSLVYGQAGSKLHASMTSNSGDGTLGFDDDEHWVLGVFYFNRDDASVFLPERFGVGWTINLARPAAWAFLAALVFVTIAFCVAVYVVL